MKKKSQHIFTPSMVPKPVSALGGIPGMLFMIAAVIFFSSCASSKNMMANSNQTQVVIKHANNDRIRITAYGDHMMRFQFAPHGRDFFSLDHREMIQANDWKEPLDWKENTTSYIVSTKKARAVISKKNFSIRFFLASQTQPCLVSDGFAKRSGDSIIYSFENSAKEHFAGLGHDYMGRLNALDLKGEIHRRNYAQSSTRFTSWKYSEQAPLIVPFYFSSAGYGVFLNSTFTNYFNFGKDNKYEFGIDTHGEKGEMDFVFIAGPGVKDVVEHYTDLTGKPRLPPLSIFGLQLSDKGHDHTSKTPSDENWWKQKVQHHRGLGLAIDHLVNDNRWRAAGGQRCISIFEWDKERFPDPAEYASWLAKNKLTITLDWNRCISAKSAGWKPGYNLQGTIPFHEFPESAPDFSNPDTRNWMWNLFKTKAIDTTLHYPVDGLWIDEVDEMYTIPYGHQMAAGKWGELANYWFMLISKSLVQQGWDKYIGETKRPYVWMRGNTAGGQRYSTMWSGDIDTDFDEMALQIRGMQAAGISGFAFWGHDAGGFIDHSGKNFAGSPNDSIYARWSMQLGAFSPIWKPHGMGQSRWPEDRSAFSKTVAEKYIKLRYELMAYTYTLAHIAAAKGVPIVRPMLLEFPAHEEAWKFDTQFMFGEYLLVAPVYKADQSVWLPPGKWYYYWNDAIMNGNKTIEHFATPLAELPLWIKAGAIIPAYEYALSTSGINKEKVILHVYAGANGKFVLTEDDGVSEKYRAGEMMETAFEFNDAKKQLVIHQPSGRYSGAPAKRVYEIILHGAEINKLKLTANTTFQSFTDENKKQVTINFAESNLKDDIILHF